MAFTAPAVLFRFSSKTHSNNISKTCMRDRVRLAFARSVPSTLASGLLAPGVSASAVDVEVARAQHSAYVSLLRKYCAAVHVLPEAKEYPDSVFVEDAAVVLGNHALQGIAGHTSRDGEGALLMPALRAAGVSVSHTQVRIDGGDVLYAGGQFFVGMSRRTEVAAAEALGKRFGVDVVRVNALGGVLHLKCVVTWTRSAQLLVASDSATGRAVVEQMQRAAHAPFNVAWVPEDAKGGANVLDLGEAVAIERADWELLEGLRRKLEENGTTPVACDMSELAKANGSLTCCSILVW